MLTRTSRTILQVSAVFVATCIILLSPSSPFSNRWPSLSTSSSYTQPAASISAATQYASLANFTQHLEQRAPPQPHYGLRYFPVTGDSALQLKLLSAPDDYGWSSNPDQLLKYLADPKLGAGQDIYIIDTGFDPNHPEIRDQITDTWVVPNNVALVGRPQDQWPDHPNTLEGGTDHGTNMAIAAAGKTVGVAPRANLILVKATTFYYPDPKQRILQKTGINSPTVDNMWQWIITRVEGRRNPRDLLQTPFTGQSIVSFSASCSLSPGQDPVGLVQVKEAFATGLKWASSRDVIVIVSASNNGRDQKTLADFVPQYLGRANNALITVGGVLKDGNLDYQTTPASAGPDGGSISLYYLSEDLDVLRYYRFAGTSSATAAVAGLTAYFASLDSLQHRWYRDPRNDNNKGTVAMDMKKYLISWARVQSRDPFPVAGRPNGYPLPPADSIIVAYNGAHHGLSNTHLVDPPGDDPDPGEEPPEEECPQ